jgi:tetratricopeptide (TPR) repeat protein
MSPREVAPEYQSRIAELRRLIDSDPNNPAFAELAELYRAQGKLAEAYEIARNGIRMNQENGWAHFIFGRICLEMGKLAEAEKEFRTSTSILIRDIEPYLLLGQTLMRRRDYSGARVVLVRLEELFPTRPEVARFRRYLEQKLIPPMDFGAIETDKLLERYRGESVPPPPVRTSVQPVEIVVTKTESPLDERAKGLISLVKEISGVDGVVFVSRENKIFRTTNISPNFVKLFSGIIKSFTKILQRAPKALYFGIMRNFIMETERSTVFIMILREGWLACILNEDAELGFFRIQLSRLFRKFDLNPI